jgi:hypothetical protein
VISRDKTYKLRNGWTYKLYNILSEEELSDDKYTVHGAFFNKEEKEWVPCKHTIDGLFFINEDDSEWDLIESTQFDHINIDDKVVVWKNALDNIKCHRHFAGASDTGKPMCWSDGKTSFTTTCKTVWDHCELFIE